jgi:antitoxin component YwqK of YwqJK toxin-antitoxin module
VFICSMSWKSFSGLIFVFLMSCDFFAEPDPYNTDTVKYINYDHKTHTGTRIKLYDRGQKKSITYFKKGKRDSLFRSYYSNKNPKLEIWYDNGKKQGLYKYYRYEGPIYREIEYKDDLKHGTYTEYWENGKVKYTLEYENGMPIDETLKEYRRNGEVKPDQFLVINEKNTVKTNGQYTVYVYFADLPKKAQYYVVVDNVPY